MALMPMIAVTARSRDIIQFSMVAAPVIGMVVWTLAGISMLGARSRIGSGLAITIFVLLLVSAIWDLTSLILLFSRAVRGRSARETFAIVSLIFAAVRIGGIVCVGIAFLMARKPGKLAR